MRIQTERENWDSFWKKNTESRFTKLSWSKIRIMKLLDAILKPGMSALDAGCGSGFFSHYFLSRGCKTYTLDYSQDALNIARGKTADKCTAYLRRDLLDPDFGEEYKGTFDVIFTDGLFEHFTETDQQKIIGNFRRAKNDTGLITTFVPNKYSWWEVIRPLVMPGIHEEPFTMASLLKLHDSMEIVKKGGINVFPIAISPDRMLGPGCGMLLYCFAK